MTAYITPDDLQSLLDSSTVLALLDVREQGEYNQTHIAGSCSLPRRLIEFNIGYLVPFKGTKVVLCDDDGSRAHFAAGTLERMGYHDCVVLKGGINRWTSLGHKTEWGMNVPSKDFGEKVQVELEIPEVTPQDLAEWIARRDEVIIVDSRTPEEHEQYCIPGSISVPGGELPLRIWDIVEGTSASLVVHCAGRTRSIIGTSLLKRMGLKNIYGLTNGTMGWQLAGLDLELASDRIGLRQPSAGAIAKAETFARKVALEDGVRFLTLTGFEELLSTTKEENMYLIDVRTAGEYSSGHITGFRWYPGGQAVQQIDDVMAVKTGHIVFCCDGFVRASITGSWYRQMGYPNVYAIDGGTEAWKRSGCDLEVGPDSQVPFGLAVAQDRIKTISSQGLNDVNRASDGPVVLFVGTSREFADGHISGSHWIPRGFLEISICPLVPELTQWIVVSCSNGTNSFLAAHVLENLGYKSVEVLDGGIKSWVGHGFETELGLSRIMSPPNDLVTMGSNRNFADAINYLRWEEELGDKYQPKY